MKSDQQKIIFRISFSGNFIEGTPREILSSIRERSPIREFPQDISWKKEVLSRLKVDTLEIDLEDDYMFLMLLATYGVVKVVCVIQ